MLRAKVIYKPVPEPGEQIYEIFLCEQPGFETKTKKMPEKRFKIIRLKLR
jgi:hypothetical protein